MPDKHRGRSQKVSIKIWFADLDYRSNQLACIDLAVCFLNILRHRHHCIQLQKLECPLHWWRKTCDNKRPTIWFQLPELPDNPPEARGLYILWMTEVQNQVLWFNKWRIHKTGQSFCSGFVACSFRPHHCTTICYFVVDTMPRDTCIRQLTTSSFHACGVSWRTRTGSALFDNDAGIRPNSRVPRAQFLSLGVWHYTGLTMYFHHVLRRKTRSNGSSNNIFRKNSWINSGNHTRLIGNFQYKLEIVSGSAFNSKWHA